MMKHSVIFVSYVWSSLVQQKKKTEFETEIQGMTLKVSHKNVRMFSTNNLLDIIRALTTKKKANLSLKLLIYFSPIS